MWVMTTKGILSIVKDRTVPGQVLVRARNVEALKDAFPEHDIVTMSFADYRYRCFVSRHEAATRVASMIMDIEYDNFKNAVEDHDVHDCYVDVWATMRRLQR